MTGSRDKTPQSPPTPGSRPTPRRPRSSAPKASSQTGERLQKYLSACGVASRRACETLILEGRVDVNGVTVTELGVRIDPSKDEVRLDGEKLRPTETRTVIVLNKPVGFLSAASDPESRPLVYHLIPRDQALRSIGRLDFNTEGVLLFTNDGDLAERLGHARYSVQRVYEARVRGLPTEETLARLRQGVRLEDGPARAEQVEIVKTTDKNAWLRLTLIEGRNREVRRLLERVGHPVIRLRRIAFAGVTTAGLPLGQWRELDARSVAQLRERGHVGAFELPPDPRRKNLKPQGLSTGPGPKETAERRGAGRLQGQGATRPNPPTKSGPPGKPSKSSQPGKPAGKTGGPPASPGRPGSGKPRSRKPEFDLPMPPSRGGGKPRSNSRRRP